MSDKIPALTFQWDGEAFYPANRGMARKCDKHYVVGQLYSLVEDQGHSTPSRNHYFAELDEARQNLSDADTARFPTRDHLRKWALVQTGYRDEVSHVCASKAEAVRLAAFIRPMDTYAVVIPSEAVVLVLTAKSQSKKAMGAKVFQESKTAVLQRVSDLIGVDTAALKEAAAA